jgi:urease accessory protein UreF
MSLTRKLTLGAVGVAVLVGTGAAVAAASGHGHAKPTSAKLSTSFFGIAGRSGSAHARFGFGPAQGFGFRAGGLGADLADDFAAAASYLGVTTDQLKSDLQSGKTLAQIADSTSGKSAAGLIDALVAHAKTQIAAAVTAGKLTQAQADMITANLQQLVTNVVNGTRPAFAGPGKGFGVGPGDDLAAAASYLGITTAQLTSDLQSGKTLAQVAAATSGKSASGLIDALVAHEKSELAAAVTAGKLTQAQADAITANLQQRMTDLVNGTFTPKPGMGPGFGSHGGPGDDFAAAATYLGVSTSDLMTQLQSGKTLGQIADATSGKSASGLIDALVAHEKSELAAAVTAGKLTQAQADALTAGVQQRVTDLVNGKPTMHAAPWGHRGWGGGPGAPASSGGTNA